jgi:dienelactone hydrolase
MKANLGLFGVMTLLTIIVAAQSLPFASEAFDPQESRGKVVSSLACLDDPSQSYALYLPSNYSPDRAWPIFYVFDPDARGGVPVEFYEKVAERYRYILVASNNSRNGPYERGMTAAQAVWSDTHRRFSIDPKRVYTMGFSGGARFATAFALGCQSCRVTGVMAHGAGFPAGRPEGKPPFLYFAAVGNADFNLPEILELRRTLETLGADFKVEVHGGRHEWAPPEVFEHALAWMDLKAMQAGTRAPDAELVHHLLEQTKAQAADAGKKGATLDSYYALRSLAADFKGIKGVDLKDVQGRLEAVKASDSLKQARKDEQREMDRQRYLAESTGRQLVRFGDAQPDERMQLTRDIHSTLLRLWRKSSSSGSDGTLYTRAFTQLWAAGIELGEEALDHGRLPQAEAYFELMGKAIPDRPYPLVHLARIRIKAGDKKGAIRALEEAVQQGLKNPAVLSEDPELQPLAFDPAFRKLIDSMGTTK